MKLDSMRICATASANYQKYEVEFTVSNIEPSNINSSIDSIKDILVKKATDGLKTLCTVNNVSVENAKVETTIKPAYNTQSIAKHPTDKQKLFLKSKGYSDDYINKMSVKEAIDLIKQLKSNG